MFPTPAVRACLILRISYLLCMAQKKPNESADCAPFRFVSVAKVGKVFGMCKKKAERSGSFGYIWLSGQSQVYPCQIIVAFFANQQLIGRYVAFSVIGKMTCLLICFIAMMFLPSYSNVIVVLVLSSCDLPTM